MNKLLSLITLLLSFILLTACTDNNVVEVEAEIKSDAEVEGINVGATAPDFSLPDAAGGTVSLSDYAGQPVLLYFHMAVG